MQYAHYFFTRLKDYERTDHLHLEVTLSRSDVAITAEFDETLSGVLIPTSLEFHLMQGTNCQRFSLRLLKMYSAESDVPRLTRERIKSKITMNSSIYSARGAIEAE